MFNLQETKNDPKGMVREKGEFMLGLCEQYIGDSLNSRQKSIIDRCVRKLFVLTELHLDALIDKLDNLAMNVQMHFRREKNLSGLSMRVLKGTIIKNGYAHLP